MWCLIWKLKNQKSLSQKIALNAAHSSRRKMAASIAQNAAGAFACNFYFFLTLNPKKRCYFVGYDNQLDVLIIFYYNKI